MDNLEDKIKNGEALFTSGKIKEAEECFQELVKMDPENAEVLNDLGVISHIRGDLAKSEDYLLKALAIKEDYLDALNNLGDLYLTANRFNEAFSQFEKYISVGNQDPTSFYNQLGKAYLERGKFEKARTVLAKSLELNPDQETAKDSSKELEKGDSDLGYLRKPGYLRGAFSEINITPDVSEHNPVLLQGLGGPPRRATAVSEPLMMELLLLEDDHFTKVLFVTADLFGFGFEIVNNVRAVAAQWGIGAEGVILNASHTHYAPGTISHASQLIGPFHAEYSKQIVQAIGQQLPMLYDRLEECVLSRGKVEAQIGVSRRLKKENKVVFAPDPKGYYDKDTPFILVHFLKTDKKALLVNHGCHPTGLGPENVISADYPGYMRNALKSNKVADGVIFLQGGAGSTKEAVSINGEVRFCGNSPEAKKNGEFLATQIIEGLEKGLQPVEGPFFCARRRILLPLKQPPSRDILAQIRDDEGTDALVREWANSVLNRLPNGDYTARLAMEVQLVSLGDKVSFITLSAEPVAELARELRRLTSNSDGTFVLGYTNGLAGYLPTDIMIEEEGYETEASQFVYLIPSALDTGAESAIISAAQSCIGAFAEADSPNGYGRYHLAKKEQKAFFVLSAGRCGTMTLAHLLHTATNARVWHHPQPDPIKESLLAYWGQIDKRKAFWKARYPIIHYTWSKGFMHGETDLLMTPFCDMLAEEIPDAKFIVLVRDPRDFVRSGMRRNYYHGHPWDIGRLRPQEGTEEFERWNKLDQFGKICWLWRKTYESINRTVNGISKDRVITVRFEDLVDRIEKTEEIFDFLGVKGFDDRKCRELISRKFNVQAGGSFPKPEDWSSELNETLWNSCGSIAEEYGYSQSHKERPPLKYNNQLTRTVPIIHTKYRPNVSVGLAVYSGGTMLSEAIESILSQDYYDLEFIVSDHGSDPLTKETCLNYQKLDRRIKYIYTGDNIDYIGIQNIARLIELSTAPYFMWASFDDKYERSFISKCLSKLQEDQSVALVYPRSRVLNEKSEFIGIGQDHVRADQEDPLERFKHVIWELYMCNAFYGLFRTHMLRKTRSLRHKLYRASDNLLLSEIALFGKIVQIEDILFIRRLTRKRPQSLEEQNADVIRSHGQVLLDEGITLPYCRLTYAHCELINHTKLNRKTKEELTQEILKCFKHRWEAQMKYEITRAIKLVHDKQFYYTWEGRTYLEGAGDHRGLLQCFHITDVLKHLQEAMFIYPDWPELRQAYITCLHTIDDIHDAESIFYVAPELQKERENR